MFIIIDEDGTVFKTENLTDDDFLSCENGTLSIINTETQKEYYRDGEWCEILNWIKL